MAEVRKEIDSLLFTFQSSLFIFQFAGNPRNIPSTVFFSGGSLDEEQERHSEKRQAEQEIEALAPCPLLSEDR